MGGLVRISAPARTCFSVRDGGVNAVSPPPYALIGGIVGWTVRRFGNDSQGNATA